MSPTLIRTLLFINVWYNNKWSKRFRVAHCMSAFVKRTNPAEWYEPEDAGMTIFLTWRESNRKYNFFFLLSIINLFFSFFVFFLSKWIESNSVLVSYEKSTCNLHKIVWILHSLFFYVFIVKDKNIFLFKTCLNFPYPH